MVSGISNSGCSAPISNDVPRGFTETAIILLAGVR
jgi:hypothetical protein